MLFVQSGNLIFAAESKSVVVDGTVINIEENDDVRICSSLEEIGQVVVTLDKHTNIMTQKITDQSSGKILNVQTWDLSKHNNFPNKKPVNANSSCYTFFGYNYWKDESPKINCIYCEKKGASAKGVYLDLAEKSAIEAAHRYAEQVHEVAKAEHLLEGNVFSTLMDIFFPGGILAKAI